MHLSIPLFSVHICNIRSISTVCKKAQCAMWAAQRSKLKSSFLLCCLFLLSFLSLSLAQYGYIHVARLRLCITKVDEVRSGSLNCKDGENDDASWEWKLKPFLWMFSLLFIVTCGRTDWEISWETPIASLNVKTHRRFALIWVGICELIAAQLKSHHRSKVVKDSSAEIS